MVTEVVEAMPRVTEEVTGEVKAVVTGVDKVDMVVEEVMTIANIYLTLFNDLIGLIVAMFCLLFYCKSFIIYDGVMYM